MVRNRTPLEVALSEARLMADEAPGEVAPVDHEIIQQLAVARLIRS